MVLSETAVLVNGVSIEEALRLQGKTEEVRECCCGEEVQICSQRYHSIFSLGYPHCKPLTNKGHSKKHPNYTTLCTHCPRCTESAPRPLVGRA